MGELSKSPPLGIFKIPHPSNVSLDVNSQKLEPTGQPQIPNDLGVEKIVKIGLGMTVQMLENILQAYQYRVKVPNPAQIQIRIETSPFQADFHIILQPFQFRSFP
jgi:hypothetical protein